MLARASLQILLHDRRRHAGIAAGVALAVFLVLLQAGFYLGYRRDITVVGDAVAADLWISQRALLAFDHVAHGDDLPRTVALGDPGVAAAAGMIAEWVNFRRGDGATDSAQVVGFDFAAGVAANFSPGPAADLAARLALPGAALVDEKHLSRFGPGGPEGGGVELRGRRVRLAGAMRGMKLFNTACLVVTDLGNARRFVGLRENQITFVAVKCRPGAEAAAVRTRLQARLPDHRVWTAREFHDLTQDYWVRLTGIGPVLLLSAGLAVIVGFVTVFLGFARLTAEKLPLYAALKAMGASTAELAGMIGLQIAAVFTVGSLASGIGLLATLAALRGTTISVALTPGAALLGVGLMAACSLAAGLSAVRLLARVDPAEAFRA